MKLRILSIGHSYVIDSNRAIVARIGEFPEIQMTVVTPNFYWGDLRPIPIEKQSRQSYQLIGTPAYLTKRAHAFFYGGLKHIIKPGAFDLVHIWEEPYIAAGFQIARLAKKSQIPYFFWTAQNLNKTYLPPFSLFERFCVNHCAGWVAGGQLVYESRLASGYPKDNSRILTLGADEELFPKPDGDSVQLRNELKLKGTVIGYVGRLNKVKGIDVLMKALEQLKSTDWSLLAIGGGPYEAKLKHWAAERGISDRLCIKLANHDDVPKYLRVMDMLVAPSQTTLVWKEQFGRMLIEAFASRVAVIASDSGEIPHVVGEAGKIVGESDVEGWAHAMDTLISDKSLRVTLAQAGFDRFNQNYSASALASQYLVYYKQLLGLSLSSQQVA